MELFHNLYRDIQSKNGEIIKLKKNENWFLNNSLNINVLFNFC